MVADASKFGQVAFTAIAPLRALHRIFGEAGIPADIAQAIQDLGVELMLV